MHRTRRRAVLRERREQAAARELLRVMRIVIDRNIKRLLDDQPKAYCNPGGTYFKGR